MQKRNFLNSPRLLELKRRRRRAFLKKISTVTFVVLLFVGAFAYTSHIESFNISEIQISGNKIVETKLIQTAIEAKLKENYLWFFPKTNILIYPKGEIKELLQNNFKRLKDISLSVKDGKILEVNLTERVALYTWCGDKKETPETCYFMDGNGFVFDEAPYFSGNVYFKFYGKVVDKFERFITFKKLLEDMKLKPVALAILDNGDAKVYLAEGSTHIQPEILFKIDADLITIAGNLQTALSTDPLQTNFKNKYSSLLYIDLRYGNKVYYKFR
jgi:cell division septal protein FtsQ